MRGRLVRAAAVIVPAVVLMAGCVFERGGSASSPVSTVSPRPPRDSVARDDLEHVREIPWHDPVVVSQTAVRISFDGGDPDCYGISATVSETASRVRVRLVEGTLPGASATCSLVGVRGTVVVRLDRPLGDRELVDAAE